MEKSKDYENGFADGIKQMEERILRSVELGKPLEIRGRAYFIKTDIENLRDIIADFDG